MQHRVRVPATTGRKRFATARFGLPRVLTALTLLIAMLVGVPGTARGAQCSRRVALAASATHQHAVSAADLDGAAPDTPAPSREGSPPVPSQGCTSSIALPVLATIPVPVAPAQAPPLERLAALVAMHDPTTLFRPPRVI
jgi:hypothetical protein